MAPTMEWPKAPKLMPRTASSIVNSDDKILFIYYFLTRGRSVACIAQRLEHLIRNEKARGSNPRSGFCFIAAVDKFYPHCDVA